jgi:hypothetical protein
MAYLSSQRTQDVQIMFFMFDRTIYRQFVPNTAWKRDSLQMMIFVNVCSTWSMVELKTHFEMWIKGNDVNGVSLFHLCYLIMLMFYLCSQWTSNLQMKYFMFHWSIYRLLVLNRGWKRDSLQILLFVYVTTTCSIGELKARFETWITGNDVNGESLLHISYLITLIPYLRSQRTQLAQINFFYVSVVAGQSISAKCGLETWFSPKVIFENVCSTWSMVEEKRFLRRE